MSARESLSPLLVFGGAALFVVVASLVIFGYSLYRNSLKFYPIAKIPPPSEYNLSDPANQAAYERLKAAYDELEQLLKTRNPEAPILNAGLNRALAFTDLGDTGRAILAYEWVNKYRPKGLQGFVNLGNLYVRVGKYNKAEKLYLKAIANSQGKHLDPYEGLFNLYRDYLKEKWPQIEEVLLTAISQDPTRANFRLLLAQYYESAGRNGEAIMQYREVLKNDPKNAAIKSRIQELGGKV